MRRRLLLLAISLVASSLARIPSYSDFCAAPRGPASPADALYPLRFVVCSDTAPDGPRSGFYAVDPHVCARHLFLISLTVKKSALVRSIRSLSPRPRFVINCGDLVVVGPGTNESAAWTADLFDVIDGCCDEMPFYFARGNHDRPPESYAEAVELPLHYSFDWGGVHVAAIDTGAAGASAAEQLAWLDSDLANATAAGSDWAFVAQHHPLFSTSWKGCIARTRQLGELEGARGVAAVFSGHDHDYERIYPLLGPHWFVVGTGWANDGAKMYSDEWSARFERYHAFLIVDVLDENVTLIRAVRSDDPDRVFDEVRIDRSRPFDWYGRGGNYSTACSSFRVGDPAAALKVTAGVVLLLILVTMATLGALTASGAAARDRKRV